jgi:uncharacterized Zn finger protein (UPF0148 family)
MNWLDDIRFKKFTAALEKDKDMMALLELAFQAGAEAAQEQLKQEQGELIGKTNSGDETGGKIHRFGWLITGAKPEIIPATNGAYVWYSDYLELYRKLAKQEQVEPVGEAYLCDRCLTPFDGAYECPSCGHHSSTKEPVYTTPQQRMQEADLSKLKPENQQQMREWIADGSFVQRAIDTMFDLSQEITALAKQEQGEPVVSKTPPMDALNFFTATERIELWKKHHSSDAQIAVITQAVLAKLKATPQPKQQQGEPLLVQTEATVDEMHAIGQGIMYGEQRSDSEQLGEPLTDEQAHRILLDMADHAEKVCKEEYTQDQLSGECVRYILARVAAHGIKGEA